MSKKATEFQRKAMSWMYRGKEIFKPLNTGRIDENVACVREWVANIFFYRKGDTTIMVDAGYNYDRLAEKMGWLGIDPKSIHHILITHQDTDHVGAVEADSPGLFRNAKLYMLRLTKTASPSIMNLRRVRRRNLPSGLDLRTLCPPCAMWTMRPWNCSMPSSCGRPPAWTAADATIPSAAIRIHT